MTLRPPHCIRLSQSAAHRHFNRCCVCLCSYLLNPVSILSCASLSLVTFTNLLLTAALASGAQGTCV